MILSPGESLFVCNRGIAETNNQYGLPLGDATLARTLREELTAPPERMIERVRDLLETQVQQAIQHDRSILMVKRLARIKRSQSYIARPCRSGTPQSSRHLDPQANPIDSISAPARPLKRLS